MVIPYLMYKIKNREGNNDTMTDKQRITNLKHQVEFLTKENEELKARLEAVNAAGTEKLADDLRAARENYEDLINDVLEQKNEYEELIRELKKDIKKYQDNIQKCISIIES